MKILINFDKAVADGLADKVKTRLTFKVSLALDMACRHVLTCPRRATSIPTASVTTSGRSLSKTSTSSSTTRTRSTPTESRLSAVTQSVLAKSRAESQTLLARRIRQSCAGETASVKMCVKANQIRTKTVQKLRQKARLRDSHTSELHGLFNYGGHAQLVHA
jgi:hypothetical protein